MARGPKAHDHHFKTVTEGAEAHDALLRELFKSVVPLLGQAEVPPFIKILVTGLIFLGVSTSAAVVVLLADVATSFAGHQIDVRTYLAFIGASLGVLLLAISFATRAALRFENEHALAANMHAVTQARRQRRGKQMVTLDIR